MAEFLVELEDGTKSSVMAHKAIEREDGEVVFYENDGRGIVALLKKVRQFWRIDNAHIR